ncbi:serine hydrolase domain-containing protein [Hyphobacterium sp. HN65]|uniref:Serine hydrolase domain-containing protein n=1 Tax=Hyphobacterium lacteum TaxID=3116575 RepID=A0ABU7LTS2_9PROT|nr:serine hydrolase domain-containing protein [Hyphobacterium sp. HN65]MEE2527299.1 serine hydrolase domain-containing protein [Hyphobacterium sp. HN65]
MTDTPDIKGHTAPGFEPVADMFASLWDGTDEIGAAFAIEIGGERVVDLHAGWTSIKRETEWANNTLVPVFSASKPITAITMGWLKDRGHFGFSDNVASYWPEFARNGKADISIAQALSYQGGLCGLSEPGEATDWFDRQLIEAKLAAQAPLWTPGNGSGYHPITAGFIADAIARRTDGRTIGQILKDEIAGPRGIDFFVGTPESEHARVAEHRLPSQPPHLGEINEFNTLAFLKPWSTPGRRGTTEWRKAEFPAANGHSNAAALATLMGVFANEGRLQGETLLQPGTVGELMTEQVARQDRVLPFDLSFGISVIRNRTSGHFGPEPLAVGQYGMGGSCGFADPERHISGSFTPNRLGRFLAGDPRAVSLINAVYGCL